MNRYERHMEKVQREREAKRAAEMAAYELVRANDNAIEARNIAEMRASNYPMSANYAWAYDLPLRLQGL